jgi:hypothetical protein
MPEMDHHARLAVLEHRVNNFDMKITAIDNKLDELLQLRSKGMGAFWLASSLFGTSILGLIITMVNWMKG